MVAKEKDTKVEVKLDTTKTKKTVSAAPKKVKPDVDVEVKVKKVAGGKKDKEVVSDLSEIKDLVDTKELKVESFDSSSEEISTVKYTAKQDNLGRSYATGKRKDAVARVWIKLGKGNIVINGKAMSDYFRRPVLQMIVNQPFAVTDRLGGFDCNITVSGGGLSGQAGAVKHGISKALCNFNPELRPILKKSGFLTRDARTVERKKFGHAKARRSFQFSKR